MSKNEINKLCELEHELLRIRDEFSEFKPSTDWNRMRVEPLIAHLKLLKGILPDSPTQSIKSYYNLDIEYFKENIEGLKMVLKSEKKYK